MDATEYRNTSNHRGTVRSVALVILAIVTPVAVSPI